MRLAKFSNAHHGAVYVHPDHIVRVVENKNRGGVNVTLSTSSENKPEIMHFDESLELAVRIVNVAMRPRAEKARFTAQTEPGAPETQTPPAKKRRGGGED